MLFSICTTATTTIAISTTSAITTTTPQLLLLLPLPIPLLLLLLLPLQLLPLLVLYHNHDCYHHITTTTTAATATAADTTTTITTAATSTTTTSTTTVVMVVVIVAVAAEVVVLVIWQLLLQFTICYFTSIPHQSKRSSQKLKVLYFNRACNHDRGNLSTLHVIKLGHYIKCVKFEPDGGKRHTKDLVKLRNGRPCLDLVMMQNGCEQSLEMRWSYTTTIDRAYTQSFTQKLLLYFSWKACLNQRVDDIFIDISCNNNDINNDNNYDYIIITIIIIIIICIANNDDNVWWWWCWWQCWYYSYDEDKIKIMSTIKQKQNRNKLHDTIFSFSHLSVQVKHQRKDQKQAKQAIKAGAAYYCLVWRSTILNDFCGCFSIAYINCLLLHNLWVPLLYR